jgi:hypothetical protein
MQGSRSCTAHDLLSTCNYAIQIVMTEKKSLFVSIFDSVSLKNFTLYQTELKNYEAINTKYECSSVFLP